LVLEPVPSPAFTTTLEVIMQGRYLALLVGAVALIGCDESVTEPVPVADAAVAVELQAMASSAAPALVQKDFFTGGPVNTPLGQGTITNSNYIQTPSGNWQISVQGTLNNLDNAPDRAQMWDEDTVGTFCWVAGEEIIRLVVNPNGSINLLCKNN
jgi:hypothetical protein